MLVSLWLDLVGNVVEQELGLGQILAPHGHGPSVPNPYLHEVDVVGSHFSQVLGIGACVVVAVGFVGSSVIVGTIEV